MAEGDKPQNMVQAVGGVADSVVSGLKQQPLVLALIVLNCLGIGGGIWFLSELAERQHARAMVLLEKCLAKGGSGAVEWPTVGGWPPGGDPT